MRDVVNEPQDLVRMRQHVSWRTNGDQSIAGLTEVDQTECEDLIEQVLADPQMVGRTARLRARIRATLLEPINNESTATMNERDKRGSNDTPLADYDDAIDAMSLLTIRSKSCSVNLPWVGKLMPRELQSLPAETVRPGTAIRRKEVHRQRPDASQFQPRPDLASLDHAPSRRCSVK
jgi:hypothetical protein